MLDDILDLFVGRKRRRDAEGDSSRPTTDLPFDVPFLDGDDDEEQDRRRPDDDHRATRHPSPHRSRREGDWF